MLKPYRVMRSLIFVWLILAFSLVHGQTTKEFQQLRDSFTRYEYADTVIAKNYLRKLESLTGDNIENEIEYYLLAGWLKEDRSDLYQALSYFRKSAELAKAEGFLQREADAYGNMANIYENLGITNKSMEFHQQSLAISEEILRSTKDSSAIKKALSTKSAALGNLSFVYKSLGELDKSIELLEESMAIDSITKDYDFLATGYSGLGNIYREKKDYNKALEVMRKCIQIREFLMVKNNYVRLDGLFQAYHSIGNIYKDLRQYDSAYIYYQKSESTALKAGDRFHLTYVYLGYGSLEEVAGDPKKAIKYYLKAYEIAQSLKSNERVASVAGFLSDVYFREQNFENAYKYLKINTQYKDSNFNADNLRELGRAEVNYKFKFKSSLDSLNYSKQIKENEEKNKAEAERRNLILIGVLSILMVAIVFSIYLIKLYRDKKKANEFISEQKKVTETHLEIIEEKQKEIVDSINYAKRIQVALLANEEIMKKYLPEHFVFFQPKDIVSGDFYWFSLNTDLNGNQIGYLAVCDSTGHGVPGAFMSLLNISFLNEAINEKLITEPNLILNHARLRLTENLSAYEQKDGFDGTLIKFNFTTKEITYAAANTSPIIFDGEHFENLPYDRMPVGVSDNKGSFSLYKIPKDFSGTLYLTTDGILDQFGGDKGKKLKQKGFLNMLKDCQNLSSSERKNKIIESFNDWKGKLEQLDDVCMIGIEI